jgi:hypothetical protein
MVPVPVEKNPKQQTPPIWKMYGKDGTGTGMNRIQKKDATQKISYTSHSPKKISKAVWRSRVDPQRFP